MNDYLIVLCFVKGSSSQRMQRVEEVEALVSELKRQLEDENLNLEQRINLLNTGLNSETPSVILVCLT